jgi:hypothetical protein
VRHGSNRCDLDPNLRHDPGMHPAISITAALIASLLVAGCSCVTYPAHLDNRGVWVQGRRTCR